MPRSIIYFCSFELAANGNGCLVIYRFEGTHSYEYKSGFDYLIYQAWVTFKSAARNNSVCQVWLPCSFKFISYNILQVRTLECISLNPLRQRIRSSSSNNIYRTNISP